MAVRKSRLETQFTGDDKSFQRVAARVQGSGKKMQAMAGKLKGAFAGLAAGMVLRNTMTQLDRIGKLATRFALPVETLQRLGHAAALAGSDLETVAKSMSKLTIAIDQADNKSKMYLRAFELLGIKHKELKKLSPEDQFLRIAKAINESKDKAQAFAAAYTLMGRGAEKLFNLLLQGPKKIENTMDQITVASEKAVRAIENLNDRMSTHMTNATSIMGNAILGVIGLVEGLGTALATVATTFVGIWKTIEGVIDGKGFSFDHINEMEEAQIQQWQELWERYTKEDKKKRDPFEQFDPFALDEIIEKGTALADSFNKPLDKKSFFSQIKEISDQLSIKAASNAIVKGTQGLGKWAENLGQKFQDMEFDIPDVIKATNIFDPTKAGGFFGNAGRSKVSAQAPKTMAQKNLDLQNGILNELKHSNQMMKKGLL